LRRVGTDIEWAHRISNFTAEITREIVLDDGDELQRAYEIEAQLGSKRVKCNVPAASFSTMEWVARELGAGAIIAAGSGLRSDN
jgi:hypothetical protein